jgi:hypothetical protein
MSASIISRVEVIAKYEKETDTMVFMVRHEHPLEYFEVEESDGNEEDDDDLEPAIIAGVDE